MTDFWVALSGLCALATIRTDTACIMSGLHRGGEDVQWHESHRSRLTDQHLGRQWRGARTEAADQLAKEGADLDGGAFATVEPKTVRQGRLEVQACLRYVATCHGQMEGWHDCDEPKSRTITKVVRCRQGKKTVLIRLNGDVPKEAEECEFHVLVETQSGWEWNSIRDAEYEETHTNTGEGTN